MKSLESGIAHAMLHIIGSITFLRHGNALKAAPGCSDAERKLSTAGLSQAIAMRSKLYNMSFDLKLSSPLVRASHTLEIVTGSSDYKTLDDLAPGSEKPDDPIGIMFEELTYSSLQAYLDHKLGDELKKWAANAFGAILENAATMREKPHIVKPINVICAGHAVCQNAIIDVICDILERGEYDCTDLRAMARTLVLGEAEAIVITLKDCGGCSVYIGIDHVKP